VENLRFDFTATGDRNRLITSEMGMFANYEHSEFFASQPPAKITALYRGLLCSDGFGFGSTASHDSWAFLLKPGRNLFER
jgi:hypothetical protein